MKSNLQTKNSFDKDSKPKSTHSQPKKHNKGEKRTSKKLIESLHNDLLKESGAGLNNLFLIAVVTSFNINREKHVE